MNDQSTTAIEINELASADVMSTVDIGDDYEAFKKFLAEEDDEPLPGMATTGLPGSDIAFSNLHCATEEEADAAHVAFLCEVWEISDEDL